MIATILASTALLWVVLFGPAWFFGPDEEPETDEEEAWYGLMDEVDRDHEAEWGPHVP